MCGLVGLLSTSTSEQQTKTNIINMKKTLQHRGPDDDGQYFDFSNIALGFGHQRLAIIDPEHGTQPKTSNDGAVTIIFNGAIYNYLELRRELIDRGHAIHSYSDTEVLLYAYIEWGESCLEKLNGMFAFAIWDKRQQQLFCARDRVGIKPFYFYFNGDHFVFASEIKAIIASDFYNAKANLAGLQDYFTFQFCLGDKTLFSDIHKLEPAHCLKINLRNGKLDINDYCYWKIDYEIDEQHDEQYFTDNIATLLEDSMRQQIRSDVPLGAHLSGGLDSSTVVSLTAPMLEGISFKTFTGAFSDGPAFDETAHAKTVAKKSGSLYHDIYIPEDEFSSLLPKLIYYMDEPAAGPGLIPQYYVSRLASEHVKVVLGGQGGDEIYIGYARYLVAYLEKCLQGAMDQTAAKQHAITLDTITPYLPLLKNYKPMLQEFWQEGMFSSDDQRYFKLIDRSNSIRGFLSDDLFQQYDSFSAFSDIFNRPGLNSLINKMTYFDLKASLPALLQVEDRMSMAVSLESRVPLLDHRLIELMATIPPNIKFANGQTKYLLKQAVKNIVPSEIVNRQDKMGFPVPLNKWLNNSAQDFVADVLFSQQAKERGFYDIKAIEVALKQEHQFSRTIWGLLCIELWHRIYIDGDWKVI